MKLSNAQRNILDSLSQDSSCRLVVRRGQVTIEGFRFETEKVSYRTFEAMVNHDLLYRQSFDRASQTEIYVISTIGRETLAAEAGKVHVVGGMDGTRVTEEPVEAWTKKDSEGMEWKLVDYNYCEVRRFDVICYQGEDYRIEDFIPARHSGSTGRIVTPEGAYYPSVAGCRIIPVKKTVEQAAAEVVRERRVVVRMQPASLYYWVATEEDRNGTWTQLGLAKMVHENKLEDTIATELRGPSMFAKK